MAHVTEKPREIVLVSGIAETKILQERAGRVGRGQARAGQRSLGEKEVSLRENDGSWRFTALFCPFLHVCVQMSTTKVENSHNKSERACLLQGCHFVGLSVFAHARSTTLTVHITTCSKPRVILRIELPQRHNWTHTLFPPKSPRLS